MLSDRHAPGLVEGIGQAGLNAPYGARCFLTRKNIDMDKINSLRLNAPYGARCFLTPQQEGELITMAIKS